MPEGSDAMKRGLDNLEKWGPAYLMQFDKAICRVMHMDQGNSWYQYSLQDEEIEIIPVEDLGVMVDENWAICTHRPEDQPYFEL